MASATVASAATGRPPGEDQLDVLRRQARARPLLSAAEEANLARRIERGELKAKERLTECNLRLVFAIAREHQWRGLPFADLVQEGSGRRGRDAAERTGGGRNCRRPSRAGDCPRGGALGAGDAAAAAREQKHREIGDRLGVGEERSRQIELEALRRLRAVAPVSLRAAG
jgi:DNA-directed RNA polymerase sigma subunit (sigma70/sigma32)